MRNTLFFVFMLFYWNQDWFDGCFVLKYTPPRSPSPEGSYLVAGWKASYGERHFSYRHSCASRNPPLPSTQLNIYQPCSDRAYIPSIIRLLKIDIPKPQNLLYKRIRMCYYQMKGVLCHCQLKTNF